MGYLAAGLSMLQEEIPYGGEAAAAFGMVFMLCWLAFMVLMIAAAWMIFSKAGEPGWAAIIPIYNVIVLLKVVGKPLWWFLLLCIPFVNFVVGIILSLELAKKFGQGTGFGIGLIFLPFIFYPILGFGSARYQG
jgi:ABC-type sulfate transport system permease subunit